MADPKSRFAILADFTTAVGQMVHRALQGDPILNRNAVPVLGFKNAAAQFRYPAVDAQDRVLVSANAGDLAELAMPGELAAGSLTLADVTGAVITLQNSYQYQDIEVLVCSREDSLFQVVWDDDGSETVLGEIIVAAGHNTVAAKVPGPFASGATGTQELKLVAMNFEVLASLRGTIGVTEVQ